MFNGVLYPYQQPAVDTLLSRGSLLLAFAPGTGKTPTAIAAAEKLMDEGFVHQVLVMCPASLKYQWQDRINEFTDSTVTVIDGSLTQRDRQYIAAENDSTSYTIVSYDSVIFDHGQLLSMNPELVILDEASAIKSFRTQRSKKVKKLFSHVPYRLALTATPIENKPDELFSIMQFVDPTVLGRYDLFDKAYINRHKNGWVQSYKNLDVLNQRLGDAMIRKTRNDKDVKSYLPDVDISDWLVSMTPKVREVYSEIAKDMLVELGKVDNFREVNIAKYYTGHDESSPPGRLMAMHMCMEMLLCHPDLIVWSAKEFEKDSPDGSEYAYLLWKSGAVDELTSSSKLSLLVDKLTPILDNTDSKILIYSKYKFMLELIRDRLPCLSVTFTGDMSSKKKAQAVKAFSSPSIPVFLSSYAGGYGLDMNMADYLINYDHPWSFGAQDQINSRHVRASSTFSKVYVRNLVVAGSIEERKMRTLDRKRRMSELAIDGVNPGDDPFGATVALDSDFLRNHLITFTEKH